MSDEGARAALAVLERAEEIDIEVGPLRLKALAWGPKGMGQSFPSFHLTWRPARIV